MKSLLVSAASLALFCGIAAAQQQDIAPPAPKAVPPAEIKAPEVKAPEVKAEEKITLHVGDAAPALSVKTWVKGKEVKQFEKGKVYVVEFWATWCGPCIQSIPHLTELAANHKDVTFMGIAASERNEKEGTDTRLEKLKAFVTKQGAKMAYNVGFDPDRKMSASWMAASGQKGIPCAFIVGGDGKIAWIGHPMELDEHLADAVKANTTDTSATKTDKKADKSKSDKSKSKKDQDKIKGK
jgi:hypothetical protein